MKLVDVSYCQQNVDFNELKLKGIMSIIIRTGYKNKTDTKFLQHIENAIKNGFNIGVYTFNMSDSINEAKEEAQETIERITPYKEYINLPIFSDLEHSKYFTGNWNEEKRSKIINTFCDEIKKQGYLSGIYTNGVMLETHKHLLKNYPVWLAHWTGKPWESKYLKNDNIFIHQYGTTNIYGEKVDINESKKLLALIEKCEQFKNYHYFNTL